MDAEHLDRRRIAEMASDEDIDGLLREVETLHAELAAVRAGWDGEVQTARAFLARAEQAEAERSALAARLARVEAAMRRFTSDLPNYVKRSTGYKLVREALASVSPPPRRTTFVSLNGAEMPDNEADYQVSVSPPPSQEAIAICERCQMRLPERLVTFGIGVRGGTAARCAACNPQPGPDGEAKRQEVIAMRRGTK